MVAQTRDASQLYRFKDITTVPGAKDLIDQVLSKTQRKTPTVVHPQYQIGRIRSFYMRKVKFCQQTFHDRLAKILTDFPRVDDIHPFYADLCNVLYDRDHYKLALGQANAVRGVVDSIAKEYVRLLKYADSPYKCKMLKRAAMGRMCTAVKRLQKALDYLEEVRKHLSRLPAINPFSRTLLLAGHPNVGKSTFMNALSNANVEVQPFPFTTKAPYVGHFDYSYQSWQLLDTPGVLDRPLAARNTIELTAITAMAHLNCAILFLIDISGTCGYSVEDQVKLYHSLKSLIAHKPVLVCLNKCDLRKPEELSEEEKELIKSLQDGVDLVRFVSCSTLERIGLDEAKNAACEMLIATRAQKRQLTSRYLTEVNEHVYCPDVTPPADRQPYIPASVLARQQRLASAGDMQDADEAEQGQRILERDRMEIEGGAGVYVTDDRKYWDLENEGWKYDLLPEFMDGKNIADFIDADIDAKLAALEAEEAELDKLWNPETDAPTQEWYDFQDELRAIFHEKEKRRMAGALKKKKNSVIMPRRAPDIDQVKASLASLGIDSTGVVAAMKVRAEGHQLTERDAEELATTDESSAEEAAGEAMEDSEEEQEDADGSRKEKKIQARKEKLATAATRKLRMFAIARRQGVVGKLAQRKVNKPSRALMPSADTQQKADKERVRADMRYRKPTKANPRKDQVHEADRFIGTKKPKHLYSGKRGMGKTDRR